MAKTYKLIIFDWEGTLVDTLGRVLHNVAIEANKLNYGCFELKLARQYAALGLDVAISKIFPHLSTSQRHILLNAVQDSMITQPRHALHLLPGARKIIEYLSQHGMYLAIASNKGQQSLLKAVQQAGLQPFFKIIKSAGILPPKPCPQMLMEILDESLISNTEALMIGDSVSDIEMACQLHVDAIGIDFYNQNTAALLQAGAVHVFDDYQKLFQFFENIHLGTND